MGLGGGARSIVPGQKNEIFLESFPESESILKKFYLKKNFLRKKIFIKKFSKFSKKISSNILLVLFIMQIRRCIGPTYSTKCIGPMYKNRGRKMYWKKCIEIM